MTALPHPERLSLNPDRPLLSDPSRRTIEPVGRARSIVEAASIILAVAVVTIVAVLFFIA